MPQLRFPSNPERALGKTHQEPLASIFALGTPWVWSWVLQGAWKGLSLDGDGVALGALACLRRAGGTRRVCGTAESLPAALLPRAGGCRGVLGGDQRLTVAGCIIA